MIAYTACPPKSHAEKRSGESLKGVNSEYVNPDGAVVHSDRPSSVGLGVLEGQQRGGLARLAVADEHEQHVRVLVRAVLQVQDVSGHSGGALLDDLCRRGGELDSRAVHLHQLAHRRHIQHW